MSRLVVVEEGFGGLLPHICFVSLNSSLSLLIFEHYVWRKHDFDGFLGCYEWLDPPLELVVDIGVWFTCCLE